MECQYPVNTQLQYFLYQQNISRNTKSERRLPAINATQYSEGPGLKSRADNRYPKMFVV